MESPEVKLVLKIKDVELNMTVAEAKELHQVLDNLVGAVVTYPYPVYPRWWNTWTDGGIMYCTNTGG